jgi:hypothetical protein
MLRVDSRACPIAGDHSATSATAAPVAPLRTPRIDSVSIVFPNTNGWRG